MALPKWEQIAFSRKGPLMALYDMIKQVAAGEMASKAITAEDMDIFESTEQTGDGEAQNVAHGFKDASGSGVAPSIVFIELTSVPDGGATVTYSKGTANVIVTATTGAKYVVHAIK